MICVGLHIIMKWTNQKSILGLDLIGGNHRFNMEVKAKEDTTLIARKVMKRITYQNIKIIVHSPIGEFIFVALTQTVYNVFLYNYNLKYIPILTVHQAFNVVFMLILFKIFMESDVTFVKCAICIITFIGTSLTINLKILEYIMITSIILKILLEFTISYQ